MPEPNAHVAIKDGWPLVAGNPIPYLNALRDAKSTLPGYSPGRIARPTGKLPFARFVEAHGGRAPKTVAFVTNSSGREPPAHIFARLPNGEYFCKPNRGSNGKGAFRLHVSQGIFSIDGECADEAALAARFGVTGYLIQEWLAPRQHPDAARFNPGAINTLRLVTFDPGNGARAVAATQRMAGSGHVIDNWSRGGVAVPADLASGTLGSLGVVKKGLSLVERHPDSGIVFDGLAVPHFQEAIRLACGLHERLTIRSLGWDMALLDGGPCILEANRAWDVYLSSQLNPDFLRAFLEFHLPREGRSALRAECTGAFEDAQSLRYWLCLAIGQSLASARVDAVSKNRLVLTLAGRAPALNAASARLKRAFRGVHADTIALAPVAEQPPLGLDIDATFTS